MANGGSWADKRRLLQHYLSCSDVSECSKKLIRWALDSAASPLCSDTSRNRYFILCMFELSQSSPAVHPPLPNIEFVVQGAIPVLSEPSPTSLPQLVSRPSMKSSMLSISVGAGGTFPASSPSSAKTSPSVALTGGAADYASVAPGQATSAAVAAEDSADPSKLHATTRSQKSTPMASSGSKTLLERQMDFLKHKEEKTRVLRDQLDAKEAAVLTFHPTLVASVPRHPGAAASTAAAASAVTAAGSRASQHKEPSRPSSPTHGQTTASAQTGPGAHKKPSPFMVPHEHSRSLNGSLSTVEPTLSSALSLPSGSSATGSANSTPHPPELKKTPRSAPKRKATSTKKRKPRYDFVAEFENSYFNQEEIEEMYEKWMSGVGPVGNPKFSLEIPRLSQVQFSAMLKAHYRISDSFALERLFHAFDRFNVSEKGSVDFHGWCTRLGEILRGSAEEKARVVFYLYDIDETKALEKQPVYKVLLSLGRPLDEVMFVVATVFKALADSSGKIPYDVFCSRLPSEDILACYVEWCFEDDESRRKEELDRRRKSAGVANREREARLLEDYDRKNPALFKNKEPDAADIVK